VAPSLLIHSYPHIHPSPVTPPPAPLLSAPLTHTRIPNKWHGELRHFHLELLSPSPLWPARSTPPSPILISTSSHPHRFEQSPTVESHGVGSPLWGRRLGASSRAAPRGLPTSNLLSLIAAAKGEKVAPAAAFSPSSGCIATEDPYLKEC
jgi:hypothetical protein